MRHVVVLTAVTLLDGCYDSHFGVPDGDWDVFRPEADGRGDIRDGAGDDDADADTDADAHSDADADDGDGGEVVEDRDRDGFPVGADCNDDNPMVHPGAPDACNGQDDDCDGLTDEDAVCPCPDVPRDGLFGEWLFSGDLRDTSGRGLDLADHGSTSATDRFGVADHARHFDGSSYLSSVRNTGLGPGGKTMSAWLYRDDVPLTWIETVTHAGTRLGAAAFIMGDRGERGYPAYFISQYGADVDFASPVVNLTWTHLAAVVDERGYYRLYLDGVRVSDGTMESDFVDYLVFVGAASPTEEFYSGRVDDVRIYDRALSDEEIAALHEECGGGMAPSCIGTNCYRVDSVPRRWVDAEAFCEASGEHLPVLESAEELAFVADLVRAAASGDGSFWLGLTDQAHEGTFVWVTGALPTYTNWLIGNPDDCCSGEDCIATMGGGDDQWNDWWCEDRRVVVCEDDGVASPGPWPAGTWCNTDGGAPDPWCGECGTECPAGTTCMYQDCV